MDRKLTQVIMSTWHSGEGEGDFGLQWSPLQRYISIVCLETFNSYSLRSLILQVNPRIYYAIQLARVNKKDIQHFIFLHFVHKQKTLQSG